MGHQGAIPPPGPSDPLRRLLTKCPTTESGALPAAEAGEGIAGALYSWAGTDPVGMRE